MASGFEEVTAEDVASDVKGLKFFGKEDNEKLNDELNKYHNYYLYLIEDNYQRKEIDHVSALSPITQPEEVTDAIVEADLVTTAVWQIISQRLLEVWHRD